MLSIKDGFERLVRVHLNTQERLVLMLPLIGFNLVPSLIVATFGFGLTQRDGVVMLVGWLGSAGMAAFTWVVWETVSRVLRHLWEMASGLF